MFYKYFLPIALLYFFGTENVFSQKNSTNIDSIFYFNNVANIKIETVKKTTTRTEFYINGKIRSKCDVIFGVRTDSAMFKEITSSKYKYEFWRNLVDLYNGYYIEWYENGNIKSKGKYKSGLKVGLWLYYDENNVLIKKENYSGENEYLKGLYCEYYSNGEIKVKGKYKLARVINKYDESKSDIVSMKDGMWYYYDIKGVIIKKEIWKFNTMIN